MHRPLAHLRRRLPLLAAAACVLAASCATAPAALAQNPGDSIFAGIRVHTVNLRFARADYWDSLVAYYNEGLERYLMAEVVVDGIRIDSVGVRLKGNSSYTYPNNKKSFRLAFDEFREGTWDGEKGVHLLNMWGDPSFMHDKIILDFCRDAGIPAPRANYADVYINDTLWGLYALVEHVDKRLLKNHYGNSGGDLFKAVDAFGDPGTGQDLVSDLVWYGGDDSAYTKRYELKSDDDTAWARLKAFIDTLNNGTDPAAWLPTVMNMPAMHGVLASYTLLGNLDSYIGSGRNFYFYFNAKTDRIEWVIWDVGLSFGVFAGGAGKPETMSLTYLSDASKRPLARTIFTTPALLADYLETVCVLSKTAFTQARLFPHIDSVANAIRPHVVADPRKMYTLTQFETNIESDINAAGGGGTRKPGVKSFLLARAASVATQLAALGVSCPIDDAVAPVALPAVCALEQNAPNPFGGASSIAFTLPAAADVTLELYALTGEQVLTLAQGPYPAGRHTAGIDGARLRRGVYLCSLRAGGARAVRSVVCIR